MQSVIDVQSFTGLGDLPYGQMTYHLALNFAAIINPIVSFIPFFFEMNHVHIIGALTGIATLLAGYRILMAFMSPTPLLVNTFIGSALTVRYNCSSNTMLVDVRPTVLNWKDESAFTSLNRTNQSIISQQSQTAVAQRKNVTSRGVK